MHNRFCILIIIGIIPFALQAQNLDRIGKQKPFTFHGSINSNFILMHTAGMQGQGNPVSFILSGNFNASIYGISLPFSFTISDKQRDYSQPFNQFGLSPSYKWITVHAGYRNVRFSDFTLSGHTFVGGGIELNPGKFRFGFVSGRFNRSTSTNGYKPTIDSLPEYKRTGLALKLGVGGKKSFIDLILLRIQDDTSSLKSSSADYPNRTPEQNLVTGLNSKVKVSKSLTLEGEGAVSIYTSNLHALEYESFDRKYIEMASNIITINQSTLWFTAFRTSLNYQIKGFGTKLEFRRIDPGYKSLGAYYSNSDIQNFTVSPSFGIWKRKIQVRLSLGRQQDNLRHTKKATSIRTIGSASVSFNPSQLFGLDAQYSNYSTDQKAGRLPVVESMKVYQATHNISVTPRLTFMDSKRSQVIMLMLNRSELVDNNQSTQNLSENTASTANINYMISILSSGISFNAGLSYMGMKNASYENKTRGITAGVAKSYSKEKISINWSSSLLFSKYLQNKGTIITTSFGANYQLKKHHQFRLNAFYTGNYYPKDSSIQTFNQIKGDVGYVFTF